MSNYKTEQENFWAGEFGNQYITRNQGDQLIASRIALFARVLRYTSGINSAMEFGANIGNNLLAIKQLLPGVKLSAIEINKQAAKELKKIDKIRIYHQSILDFTPDCQHDFVFTSGVLIHINPEVLPRVYELLYKTSKQYIFIQEYYNPTPTEVIYRGQKGKLFKRDFAGELMDKFRDLSLVDYGFVYHRDSNFKQDDSTWFLMSKQ